MAALWAILPTIVVLTLFFWVLRSIIRADRNARREYARIEAEERAARGLPPAPAATEQCRHFPLRWRENATVEGAAAWCLPDLCRRRRAETSM